MKYETPLADKLHEMWLNDTLCDVDYVDYILKDIRKTEIELARLKHMVNNSPLAKTCIEILENDPLFKVENKS